MTPQVILLVEDNPYDEELTLRALEKSNLANQIVVARDGVEAMDYLFGTGKYMGRDVRQTPAVVLLDLKLPKVDGAELLRRIRADDRLKFLPVVVMTSSKEQEDALHSYASGANGFVRKPVNFEEFIHAVRQIGMYWALLNEPPSSP